LKKLYFPLVLTLELAILVSFILFLIYLFPSLDPQGYQYYGDAHHVPFVEQELSNTLVIVVRWLLYLMTAGMLLPMMATIIMELIRWQVNQVKNPSNLSENKTKDNGEQVVRFDTHLKLQHYLIMIGVTLAGILGLTQAVPDWPIANWFVEQTLGGIEVKRQFHHYFAYIADFTVFYYIGYILHKLLIKKEKPKAMLFNLKDLKDFISMNLYLIGINKEEPKYDRYSFGQKIDFTLIVLGIPSLSVTGLIMYYTGFFNLFIPDVGIALTAILHRSIAIFLFWFVLSVHMYYAHLEPSAFPVNTVILTGKMSKSLYQAKYPLDSERLR